MLSRFTPKTTQTCESLLRCLKNNLCVVAALVLGRLELVLGPLVLVLPARSAGVGDLSSLEVRTQPAEVVPFYIVLYRKRAGNYITQVASPT